MAGTGIPIPATATRYTEIPPPVIVKWVCGTAVQSAPGAGSVVLILVVRGSPAVKEPVLVAIGAFSVIVSTVLTGPVTEPTLSL